jgi:hypothetical protein
MSNMSIFVRRSYAQLFAQAALASVERDTDDLGPGLNFAAPGARMSREKSLLHPQVPSQLEPILALVVLAIYEYCQRGNVSRMRARINQAVTTAMDISLHDLGTTKTAHSEAQRRTWWITVSLLHEHVFYGSKVVAAKRFARCLWLIYRQIFTLLYGCHSNYS